MNFRKAQLLSLNLVVFLFLLSDGIINGQVSRSAVIKINVQEEMAPVPKGLYGIFLEEINHAFDGGLYAELIQNRSFEEGIVPPGMKLVDLPGGKFKMELASLPAGVPEKNRDIPWPWNGNAGWKPERALVGWSLRNDNNSDSKMNLTEKNPMNSASERSLEMTISGPSGVNAKTSLINSGYWGINVVKGTSYDLKFYLLPSAFTGEITVNLEDQNSGVLASYSFGKIKPGQVWKKYSARLTATGSDAKAKLVITFEGKGSLQIDWVSLFPPTFMNRPNGLRIDLATYLKDLKPDFIRYPGGCYVEGFSWESAPDWRKMVHAPEERPGMWGYWQYRSTDGFGYHEFLQFCEDIKADAMYVAFAGMTVHPDNNMPLTEIDPTIQQTVDAIEYAIGPVSSKWGKVRAEMGHKEPFPLKYVEIGNEHPGALYGDYYKKFRDVIKAKYPQITVIMSMYWSGLNKPAIARAGDANIDIVDQHAYVDANWVRTNFDYFDKYARTPWKVYVGEYAAHRGTGDLLCGMGDALYLMMMERNGDLVKMASYAPMFLNVNDNSWAINLIEFNSSESFAHASYSVQKSFNENRPDFNLKMEQEVFPAPDTTKVLMGGNIGLGSWNTANEFKEMKVYNEKGEIIFSDEFKDLTAWRTPGTGKWSVEGGVLKQESTESAPAMLILNTPVITTGTVTVKARITGGSEGFLIFFNHKGRNRYLLCNYGGGNNTNSVLETRGDLGGYAFNPGRSRRGAVAKDVWHDVKLVIGKSKAEMFLDGTKVSDGQIIDMPAIYTVTGYDKNAGEVVVKTVNYNSEPVTAQINLIGAKKVGKEGTQIIIRSEKLSDENSLKNPNLIAPVKSVLNNCAESFPVTLPPFSVNILRIPVIK
jgi:alpha-L-arabinofuranosidase